MIRQKIFNRRTLFCLLLCLYLFSLVSVVYGAKYPGHSSGFYVNDFANVLDPSTEEVISNISRQLDDRTTAQVVVVTLPDLDDQPLEEYAIGLFRDWGIGSSETNNGVLLLLDVGGRQSRIEVGYGLEGALPDGKTGRIQDNWMLPYFQEGDYSQGVLHGFDAIVNEVYAEYGYEYEGLSDYNGYWSDDNRAVGEGRIPGSLMILGVIVIVILIILDIRLTGGVFTHLILAMFFRGGGRHGGGTGGRRGGGGSAGGGGSSRRW